MRRGDLVAVALPGDFGKPRPALIVQSDLFNETHPSLTVLPLTSEIRTAPQFRIVVEPSATNGLRRISQIMVEKPMTFRRDKIQPHSGAWTTKPCSGSAAPWPLAGYRLSNSCATWQDETGPPNSGAGGVPAPVRRRSSHRLSD